MPDAIEVRTVQSTPIKSVSSCVILLLFHAFIWGFKSISVCIELNKKSGFSLYYGRNLSSGKIVKKILSRRSVIYSMVNKTMSALLKQY